MAILEVTRKLPAGNKIPCAVNTDNMSWMQPMDGDGTHIKMIDGLDVEAEESYENLLTAWRASEEDA